MGDARTLRQNQIDGKIVTKAKFVPWLITMGDAMPNRVSGNADSMRMAVAVVYFTRWPWARTLDSLCRS